MLNGLILAFFLFMPSILLAQGLIVSQMKGNVEYREAKIADWKKANTGLQVPEKGSIRTGEKSRVSLIFHNGSKIWLKEKTTLEVEHQKSLINQINIQSGVIKTRVPHLKRREAFIIKTPTTLTAVRGTEFVLSVDEEGKSVLDVLFGEVRLDIVERESNAVLESFKIPQGTGFSGEKVALLSREQEVSGLEDWNPETADDKRGESLQNAVNNRNEVRQFAQTVNTLENEMAGYRAQVKEEDFAAGRTLVDVHGNVVRVDQRLDRPDNKTIQVINVVKRDGYSSGGFRKFKYNGSAGARFDSVRAKVEFNRPLPDSLSEFPGFFIENEDVVKVDRAELVLANTTDPNSVFTVGFFGQRDPAAASDEITPDLFVGTLQTAGADSARKQLFNLKLNSDGTVTGLTRFKSDNSIKRIDAEGVNGELYSNAAERFYQVNDNTKLIWLCSENFIINNKGSVRNVSDYVNGTADFENLLKNSAGEVGVFVKADSANTPDAVTDVTDPLVITNGNALKKNIDIVVVPDLALSIVKSLATSMDSIKNAKE